MVHADKLKVCHDKTPKSWLPVNEDDDDIVAGFGDETVIEAILDDEQSRVSRMR